MAVRDPPLILAFSLYLVHSSEQSFDNTIQPPVVHGSERSSIDTGIQLPLVCGSERSSIDIQGGEQSFIGTKLEVVSTEESSFNAKKLFSTKDQKMKVEKWVKEGFCEYASVNKIIDR